MITVYLTSEDFIKSLSPIDDNLANKYLQAALHEAQEIHLREILGDELLDTLKGMVADNSVEGPYKELIDKCQYYLGYRAIASLCITSTFKVANVGVVATGDDNIRNLAWSDLVRVKEHYVHTADSYAKQLQQFLLNNRSSFPELNECECNRIKAHLKSSASSGLWLGGIRARRLGNCCK